jgi:hypothetical protein
MKTPLKIVYGILFVVIVLVIVVVVLVHIFGNQALKTGIEKAATKTLNVGVSVADVDLSIAGGKVGLQNLIINNPPGYQHDRLLELKSAKIEVDVWSLLSDTVKIKEIKLDGANVVLEQKGLSNNIKDVMKSIPAKDKQPAEPSVKKLHIDNLEITNTMVKVKLLPIPGKADTLTLKLAPIKMTDLGGDNKLNTAALSSKILLAITEGIAKQGTGLLPKEMIDSLASELKRVGDLTGALIGQGGEILETGKDAGKGALEAGKDAGETATGALKGLLKPKEKEE